MALLQTNPRPHRQQIKEALAGNLCRFEGLRVFTNKPPCGPKRGHGTLQPRFALEVHLDKIAEDLGLTPVQIRRPHLVTPFCMTVNHLRITSCGLGDCLDAVVQRSEFLDQVGRLPCGQGIGLACSAYLSGAGLPIYYNDMPHAGVTIQIDRSGAVCVFCGAIDIGQGSDSVLVFIVAEELGLDPRDVRLITADTALTPVDLGSYASRVTFMAGNAAITAARKLRAQLLAVAAAALPATVERLGMAHGRVKALELRDRGQEPRVGPRGIPAFSFPPLRKVERPEEWLQVVPDPGTRRP